MLEELAERYEVESERLADQDAERMRIFAGICARQAGHKSTTAAVAKKRWEDRHIFRKIAERFCGVKLP